MKTTCILTRQEKLDILTTAIESNGIQYWACDYGRITIARDSERNITKAVFEADNASGERERYTVTPTVIQKGVNVLLSPGFEIRDDIKKNIITSNVDDEASDCIVQAGLFGELVYG